MNPSMDAELDVTGSRKGRMSMFLTYYNELSFHTCRNNNGKQALQYG